MKNQQKQINISFNWDRISYEDNYKNDFGIRRSFQEIRVNRSSKTRVYLTVYDNNIPMTEIAKQMRFKNGNVIIRFGQEEVVIGSYIEEFV